MIDINTHEFTLNSLATLFETDKKIARKIGTLRFTTNLKFAIVVTAALYAYVDLKGEIEDLKSKYRELKQS